MNNDAVKYIRFKRQHLIEQANDIEYEKLFRMISPVPTLFWIEPGWPPTIQHRCGFDDYTENAFLRKNRTIIKGRFQGGNIGYIYADELPLYMAAYKKDYKFLTENDQTILDTIRIEGAMYIGLIKEITGILAKHITPSLHKLQKAFVLYEDQIDNEGDRSWYILEDEFSNLDLNKYTHEEAMEELVIRFAFMNVFFDQTMVKSFTKLSNKSIKSAIGSLLDKSLLQGVCIGDKTGYVLTDDIEEIESCTDRIKDEIILFEPNDYMVRSNDIDLKERFGRKPYKTMHYIMKNGDFIGAVLGHFRFGPNDLEDVQLDLSDTEKIELKEEIISAVYRVYDKDKSPLKRYCGEELSLL